MAKGSFTVELDPKSVVGLTALANQIAIYPNKIRRARVRATERAVKRIRRRWENSYEFATVKHIQITTTNGANRSTIRVQIPRAQASSGGKESARNKALWTLNIMLNGRRAYRSKQRDKVYKLRSGQNGNYPKYLRSWRVPAKSYNQSFRRNIKTIPLKILNDMFKEELQKEGFGSRGGGSGLRGIDI
jgi:hypothetical protein